MKGGNFKKIMKSIDCEQIIVGILIIILVVLVIVYVNKNNEGFDGNKPILYLFYVDWCPHCKDAKEMVFDDSVWNSNDSLITNRDNVNLVKVDCTKDENKSLAEKYNVQGYPTIVLVTGNKSASYEGSAKNPDNVNTFINDDSINKCKQGNHTNQN